jgi:hypothetical protein
MLLLLGSSENKYKKINILCVISFFPKKLSEDLTID